MFDIDTCLSITSLFIASLALINTRKATLNSGKALSIAQRVKNQADYEYAQSYPAIDILKVIQVDGKHRVVLLLCNMRLNPFRINSINVCKRVRKKRSLENFINYLFDKNFDWNFERLDKINWNPKGNLDDSEKFVEEAGEFLVVEKKEKVLVTIPDFNEYSTYRFEVNTSHGIVTLSGSPSKNESTYFCKDFRQSIY